MCKLCNDPTDTHDNTPGPLPVSRRQMLKAGDPEGVKEDTARSELERKSQEIRDYWQNRRKQWGDGPVHDGPPQ